tara:strand:- start:1 stop:615 length:615 start_codon:yes stop_codon:yes gene_type:complete
MLRIDRILEDLQREVELYGKSGADSVFIDNLHFSIESGDYQVPLGCDVQGGIVDVAWFFQCAADRRITPHSHPDESFWVRAFGKDALPYGHAWNLEALYENLSKESTARRGILFNHRDCYNPPCVICYQFQSIHYGTLDCTVTLRSSDVAKVLPQDVFMTDLILGQICRSTGFNPGKMTFNLANAHVYYEDMEYQEEFTIDFGD